MTKYICDFKKEEFNESMIGGADYENMKIEQLTEYVDTLKKEVRKIKV